LTRENREGRVRRVAVVWIGRMAVAGVEMMVWAAVTVVAVSGSAAVGSATAAVTLAA
jgi:hypothetical protein